MKRGLSWMSGALAFTLAGGTTGLVEGQNGPYYGVPSWDQTLACATTSNCPRFIIVMGGVAVLDRETGLVWERSPGSQLFGDLSLAAFACTNKVLGGRKGWRLPTIPELGSLIDPNVPSPGPKLPAGHPFTRVATSLNVFYRSATVRAGFDDQVWAASFSNGGLGTENAPGLVWCVRGGHGTDAQ